MHNGEKSECKRGHPFTPENTYTNRKGHRVCRACVRQKVKEKREETPRPPDGATDGAVQATPEGHPWVRVLESPPGVRLETLDAFLAYYQVDLDTWEVERHVLNRYPVTVKDADGEPVVLHSFQIKVWLRLKRAAALLTEVKDALLADLRTAAKAVPVRALPRRDEDLLLEVAPVDSHFGALAWSEETGEGNYDLAIAARLYRQAVSGLLARAARDRPAAILLRVGDDYLHMDSERNQTTSGTPQDVDSRYKKVFRVGVSCAAWAARECAALAPTKLVVVPGNHDSQSTFAIGEVLAAIFADHPHVTVSPAITPRQYVEWGQVMLCLAHGHQEDPAKLPLLMATEEPAMWARTRHREAHLGHLHRKRKLNEDEYNGVRVRWLPTFKTADLWHAGKGFTGANRATEAYLWSRTRGFMGMLSEPVDVGTNQTREAA